jgi:uncharacterized protein (DUF2147 family)
MNGAKVMRRFAYALLFATSAAAQDQTLVGVSLHANKRIRVEIAPCGDRLCGKIVWLRWPNDAPSLPLVDLKNKNSALRTRPLLGLMVLKDLRPADDGRTWSGGEVYNPDDGVNYKATMSIQNDGGLRVRTYVLIPALGKTQIWTRVL